MTEATLQSLAHTVDFSRHRLILVDNASDDLTPLVNAPFIERVIRNDRNLGTAKAFNKALALRKPDECVAKIDNDITFDDVGWADRLEEALTLDPSIGVLGPKLKIIDDRPDHPDEFYRSTLRLLPHKMGERWYVVEETHHVPGAVSMWSPKLIETIGGLWQPAAYAWDDVLWNERARLAGFKVAFLHGLGANHIDTGAANQYTEWKKGLVALTSSICRDTLVGLREGTIPLRQEIA
jgi:GT2 family glycosyltransferase